MSFRDGAQGVVVAQRAPAWFKCANEEPKRKLRPRDDKRGTVEFRIPKKQPEVEGY